MNLKLLNILEFYDIPQVFVCEDDDKNKYLCMTYSKDENQINCIGVYLLNDDYINGIIDLRSAFTYPDNVKFDITLSRDKTITATLREKPFEDYMLPESGFYND